MVATAQSLKQYLHTLADELPDNATTDEALYHLVLRREIEVGLADSDAGRAVPHEESGAMLRIACEPPLH